MFGGSELWIDFPLPVIASIPISVGIFDGFSWIRCEGKGSFMNSPLLKEFAEQRISEGVRILVVDLGACSGMDSTFMGTLAGIAARLSALEGATLQIADADPRNRRSLEDLGLDFLMEIDPPAAPWRGRIDQIRAELATPAPPSANHVPVASAPRARHVLEAHQNLSHLNEKNAREFSGVINLLEKELSDRQRGPASDPVP